ncbi:MAG: hypothetical protein FIA95_02310 [Gemmatimonadetes bacterium]|nr:hypothetical protein [Gemmatimonadota bacterium]
MTIAVVGAVLFGAWLVLGRARSYVIQIDWAWTGDLATGAEVLVDGVVVGTLEPMRRRPVRGFEVEKGTHVVTLRGGPCETRPDTVAVGPGRIAVLMADVDERSTGCFVFFR